MRPVLNLGEIVAAHARLMPDKIGTRDSQRAMTFSEWNRRSCKLANALLDLGLEKGDRVALLAYNRVEWMELYIALAKAGLVAVPINFRLLTPEIQYIAEHCHAKAIVAQDELAPQVEPLRGRLSIADKAWIHIGDNTPTHWTAYEALVEGGEASEPQLPVGPLDPWALMYTSGTTGKPKGAIRNHEGMALIALVTALDMGLTRDDTALLVMPMCHANSLNFASTFSYIGATVVVDDRKSFDPEALLSTMATQRITFTSLVPTHYIMALGLPPEVKGKYDVSRVRKLMISSAPARKDTKLAILDHFKNSQLYELYGSSEAGWVTLLRPDEQIDHLGSVGREWTGSGPVKILDPQGNEVPDGEVGELYSCTPYTFDGYLNDPAKTREAIRDDGYCSVGDMARRDEQGYIHLVDRKSNMIISGGENIYPSELENILGRYPGVKDVAVVGVPHEKWGEAVHAVIVMHPGQSAAEKYVLDWCRDKMAGYKRPRSISFVDESEMPRTATGKILHRVLRDTLAGKGSA
ncbi:class I adenylate-forming enzyme family protein [Piscinibacter sakaiensis]|uniref:class I adenylate-forming enzyme family protein n=1 Tax=Piscinibacter sakaiensis TaxID=1547922 RepID=UPI003AAF93D8